MLFRVYRTDHKIFLIIFRISRIYLRFGSTELLFIVATQLQPQVVQRSGALPLFSVSSVLI